MTKVSVLLKWPNRRLLSNSKDLPYDRLVWHSFGVSRNPKTLQEWKAKNIDRQRGYYRAYYHRHKDKFKTSEKKEYQKEWQKKNRVKLREYARQWYGDHREEVSIYRKKKKIERFGPPKVRTRMPEKERLRLAGIFSRRSQESRQLLYWTLKSMFVCQRCGQDDPACLDFHHREPDGKELNVGHEGRCVSPERMLEEILKCDVICANCHRRHHYAERGGFSIKLLTEDQIDDIHAKAKLLYEQYVRHFVNAG